MTEYRSTNGEVVDVIETSEGVLPKRSSDDKAATFDRTLAKIGTTVRYTGARLDEETRQEGIDCAAQGPSAR